MIEPYAGAIRDAAPLLDRLDLRLTDDRDYRANLHGSQYDLEISVEPTYRPNIKVDFVDSRQRRFWVFGLQKVLDPSGRASFAAALRAIKSKYDEATRRHDAAGQAREESRYAQLAVQTVLSLIATHLDVLTPVTPSLEDGYAREERATVERVEHGATILD